MRSVTLIVSAIAAVLALLSPGAESAHRERPVGFPDGTRSVPEYRSDGPYLVVCNNDTPAWSPSCGRNCGR